ncbi:hypothetical protein MJO29_012549 [Puccinia striiformis f. sp. tritici]|nr:hypothetical protein MJO29_012549 [Puccinia striiformis f. sp. tritici]
MASSDVPQASASTINRFANQVRPCRTFALTNSALLSKPQGEGLEQTRRLKFSSPIGGDDVLKLITQIDELIECCCRNTGPLGIVCESTNGNIESGDSEEESGSSSESDQSNRGSRAPPIFLTF